MKKSEPRHSTDARIRLNVLRRTAKEVRRYRVHMKIARIALVMLGSFLAVIYLWSVLYQNTGSFTISLDKYEMMKYGLTLSESRDMAHPASYLNAHIVENITNISGETIPDNVDMIDGTHNGENHIAYTFYLKNAGDRAVSYEQILTMSDVTHSLDEAIRVRLFQDSVPTTYAKTASDGSGPEPGTKEFYSATEVLHARVDNFQPGQVMKYTVVVWLEGNDPDCVDRLIGGQLKMDMTMEIVH